MAFNDIITGLRVVNQEPLDPKKWSPSENILSSLGASNTLAYTYYDGMRVDCAAEGTVWEWREKQEDENGLTIDFVYPASWIVNGIDYSSKTYNFFKVLQAIDVDVDIETTTLIITKEVDNGKITFTIDTPAISDLRQFVVNNAYTGDEEIGTNAKPFKDIPQALTTFIGTGTLQSPQYAGAFIDVQPGNAPYNVVQHFTINNCRVLVRNGATVNSNPTINWSIDYELLPIGVASNTIIDVEEGGNFICFKNGCRNKGTNVASSNYEISKTIYIKGMGQMKLAPASSSNPNQYVLFDCNADKSVRGNDGGALLNIENTSINTEDQPIIKAGSNFIDFKNVKFGISSIGRAVSEDLVAFQFAGSSSIRASNCTFYYYGTNNIKVGMTLDNTCRVVLTNPILNGNLTTCFAKNLSTTQKSELTMLSSTTIDGFYIVDLNNGTPLSTPSNLLLSNLLSGKWDTLRINNCYINRASIDSTKIDLTNANFQGCINFFGNPINNVIQVREDLPIRTGRTTGSIPATDLPKNTKFINTAGAAVNTTPTLSWFIDINI